MPFSITYSSSNNDQLLRSIAGAYFKQQRLSKDLSLIEASKALHLNKGFLSASNMGIDISLRESSISSTVSIHVILMNLFL
ncbi:hypothetical protein [Bulleidia sp. HCP3S3_F2]|uniref:hypothetical protein n=1 Tax=unclassified Bulleidia TaxID=2704656 RepID=UPI003F8A9E4D